MKRVYKYAFNGDSLEVVSRNPLFPVHFEYQNDIATLWCENLMHEINVPTRYTFKIVGTGEEIPDDWFHIATTIRGPYVWHCYQVEE